MGRKEIQHTPIYSHECTLHRLLCTGGWREVGGVYFHRLDVTVLTGENNATRRFAITCSYSGREIIR